MGIARGDLPADYKMTQIFRFLPKDSHPSSVFCHPFSDFFSALVSRHNNGG
jgi:hypothetical protein